jgi:DNA-binding transcriptional LysR family regulator
MEEQLGAELFHRRGKGLSLTETGATLLTSARAMREAGKELQLRAAGTSDTLEGSVRITASVAVTVHHLPKIIASIRIQEPLISIELVPSDASSNLHFREADIAVRMYRPRQLDLVTQQLGELTLGAFAARSYVERRGLPTTPEELLLHDVVGMDKSTQIIDGFRDGGLAVTREWFKVRADDHGAHWALVRAGCGIGFGQTAIGRADPDLVEVPLALNLPRLPLWLTAHEAIRHTPRVQCVWALLAEGLRAVCSP